MGRRFLRLSAVMLCSVLILTLPGFADREMHYRQLFMSKDAKTRALAVSSVMETRREIISDLLHIVNDDHMYKENPESVVDAMRLMGKLRAKRVVGILVEHIDFQAPGADIPSRPYSPLNGREAVFALAEIGKPSVEPALDKAMRTPLGNYIRLSCLAAVIEMVEGKEGGICLLSRRLRKEEDTERQAKLTWLMRTVQRGSGRP